MRINLIKSILYLCAYLPLPIIHCIGVCIGWGLLLIPNRSRQSSEINIALCWPAPGFSHHFLEYPPTAWCSWHDWPPGQMRRSSLPGANDCPGGAVTTCTSGLCTKPSTPATFMAPSQQSIKPLKTVYVNALNSISGATGVSNPGPMVKPRLTKGNARPLKPSVARMRS